jgi:sugar phosphate isomerase/epimerase
MVSLMLSMNEVTTYRWSFDQDVGRYEAAGYGGIGVWRRKLADYGEQRGIDRLAASPLKVTNLLWAGGFTGSDGRSLQESVDDAAHAVRLAAAMEAGCLVVYSGGRNNHIARHADRLLTAALEPLLDLAEAAEVVLAIEPMHPACAAEWTFLTGIESTIRLIERFNTPKLKLVLDTYHFGLDPVVRQNLAEIVPYTALVHLGDRRDVLSMDHQRCPLGNGVVPLAQMVRELQVAGYVGDFDVELFGQDIELCDYGQLLEDTRRQFDRMVSLVSHG